MIIVDELAWNRSGSATRAKEIGEHVHSHMAAHRSIDVVGSGSNGVLAVWRDGRLAGPNEPLQKVAIDKTIRAAIDRSQRATIRGIMEALGEELRPMLARLTALEQKDRAGISGRREGSVALGAAATLPNGPQRTAGDAAHGALRPARTKIRLKALKVPA